MTERVVVAAAPHFLCCPAEVFDMPITRTFLDWKQPALNAAVEFLIDRYGHGSTLDLDNVVTVVPGGRAGRRLLETLVEQAENRGLELRPPRIETAGFLPELLYESKRPFASNLVQHLTWVHALRSLGRKRIQKYIPQLPDDEDVPRWMSLGKLLWRQHRELAGDALNFESVVEQGRDAPGFAEQPRWRFLRQVQLAYLSMLDQFGLWDMQTARLYAIEHRECRTDQDLVLVATADMNRCLRMMLDQVADRVTALVFAPEKLASLFDEHGCVIPETWQNVHLSVDPGQVEVVQGAHEQAEAVARTIASYDGRLRADEITIGVPDERLVPHLQRQLQECGLPTRWVVGKSLPQTGPYRLLDVLADYCERRRFGDFAALVRHPDIHDWLTKRIGGEDQGHLLAQLDEYFSTHLQPTLGDWLGEPESHAAIREAYGLLDQLLLPLANVPRKLSDWPALILDVLLKVYGDTALDREQPAGHYTLAACKQIRQAFVEFQSVPRPLMPTVSPTQAIRLLLEQIEASQIPPLPDESAVELLGWLELPLDHSPSLIVTSFNEGFVPKSLNSDLFLPNGLRQRLGIEDNVLRYARDAYALSVLLATRPHLKLIVARYDTEKDPLLPSRLLFACDGPTTARRALAFFDSGVAESLRDSALSSGATRPQDRSDFTIPRPLPLLKPLPWMSVTGFRSYIACPYRFYLRHVLQLQPLDDDAEELDAASFGNVIHDVLLRFGRSDQRHSTNVDEIKECLYTSLLDSIDETFGREQLPAVRVQLMQLRSRLDAFAKWQAAWAAQGWRIEHVEVPDNTRPFVLRVPAGSIRVHGRIDRIDRHVETGERWLLDYKTGDTPKKPDSVHRRGGDWTDLQLPLYRRMAKALGLADDARLGYIVLPKDVSKIGLLPAEWTPDELSQADAKADEIVSLVLEQKFWPPTDPPPDILNEYDSICQVGTFERIAT